MTEKYAMSFNFPFICLEKIDSTNSYIKNHQETWSTSFYTVYAKEQTAGKGRHGRQWISGKNNLTFSFTYLPDSNAQLSPLTIYAGLALRSALHKISDKKVLIKWPNDITYEGKKLAGILSEVVLKDKSSVIIFGIGVNINSDINVPEIRNSITSLEEISGQDYQPTDVLNEIIYEMKNYLSGYCIPLPDNIIAEFTSCFDAKATLVSVTENGKIIKKKFHIQGINQNGLLVVEDEIGRQKTIDAYEITYPEL